jgi:hypothetical protein
MSAFIYLQVFSYSVFLLYIDLAQTRSAVLSFTIDSPIIDFSIVIITAKTTSPSYSECANQRNKKPRNQISSNKQKQLARESASS